MELKPKKVSTKNTGDWDNTIRRTFSGIAEDFIKYKNSQIGQQPDFENKKFVKRTTRTQEGYRIDITLNFSENEFELMTIDYKSGWIPMDVLKNIFWIKHKK